MKLLEAINALKQYYKTHNREDVEIEGEMRVVGSEVILNAMPTLPQSKSLDISTAWRMNTTRRGESYPTDEPDAKFGRDKSGDGK